MAALNYAVAIVTSVTRFGQISPLWQKIKSLVIFVSFLKSIWPNFEITFLIIMLLGIFSLQ